MGFLDGAYQSDPNFSITGHLIFVNDIYIYMHVSKYKVGAGIGTCTTLDN